MPTTYLSDTVLTATFYSSMLPYFSNILEDFGRVYLPATIHGFLEIVRNWSTLSKLYLLRFLRDDQLEESTLFRATKSLPLERFGKEPVEEQVARYGLTMQEVMSVPGVPAALIEHYPGGAVPVRFLCLTKLRRDALPTRFENFSNEYFHGIKKRLKSRQVLLLAEESLEFLSKPAMRIQSIQINHSKNTSSYISPFHKTFLDGQYGSGRSMPQTKQVFTAPRFDPHSVGLLKLPPGSWACVKCSTINDKHRPLHMCESCSSTPMRSVKLAAMPLPTSKYLVQLQDSSSDESEDDSDDGGFCIMDEKRILREREYSEYGKSTPPRIERQRMRWFIEV